MPKNDNKALVTINEYAVMQHDPDSLKAVIAGNLGQRGANQGDLDRIKVPAGGSTTWSIPTIDGELDTKNFDGVIVAWKEPRAYWLSSFGSSGGGTPPDCSSEDGLVGVGNPGGDCWPCPMSQFGTATRDDGKPGEGQACRQMRLMAIIQQDDLVPMLLAAPPTSLQPLRKYFLRLARRVTPYYGVVTRFTLTKAKSKGGVEYSQIEANALETLGTDQLTKMQAYAKTIEKSLERQRTQPDSFQ